MHCWLVWFLIPGLGPLAVTDQPGWHVDPRVSGLFACSVASAHDGLPAEMTQTLIRRGWRIEVVPAIVTALPELADSAPRGWPAGWTWKNVDAVHLPGERRLVFAEWRVDLAGNWVRCHRVVGVVRHELAHAWDVAWSGKSGFSDSSEFRLAYQLDVDRLSRSQRRRLAYFVQPTAAGRQETLAELLAISLGGGSTPNLESDLKVAFSSSWKLVRAQFSHGRSGAVAGIARK